MPVYRGTFFDKIFTLKQASDGAAIDVSGWTFRVMIRDDPDDTTELLELTTANGGFIEYDAPAGQVVMKMTAVQTLLLPAARVHFDVLRTDPSDGPVWLFGGRFLVKTPVTRDD